jgi:hypothetical protein
MLSKLQVQNGVQALCKGGESVHQQDQQPPFEACFKSKDLQAVLALVGCTDGSRKKRVRI